MQPNDYLLLSGGAIAYEGRTVPTGSMLSLGFNWAQLDIGYRDHWLSPADRQQHADQHRSADHCRP